MASLTETIYDEVRRIAGRQLRRERSDHSLRPTELAHEVLARLIASDAMMGASRNELLRRAARQCRQVLVDHARRRRRLKRGGGLRPLQLLVDPPQSASPEPVDLLELDAAMDALAKVSPRQAEVVMLKVYGGVGTEAIAALLGVAVRTVEGDWTFARAWLRREILKRRGEPPQ